MNKTIPKSSNIAHKNPYTTKTIKRITKHKSYLLTKLHHIQRYNHNNRFHNLIHKIKTLIKHTRHKIQSLINERVENHWEKTLSKIDHRRPEKFFFILNKIFRPRSFIEPPSFIIRDREATSLENSRVNLAKYQTTNKKYNITTTTDKANILGAYFESVNSPRQLNASSQIETLVDNEIKIDKQSFDNRM